MSDQLGLDFKAPRRWRTSAVESLHVRSHMRAEEVLEGDRKAKRQEVAIIELFRYHDDQGGGQRTRWTPSEVHAAFQQWPLTSIRRAMTNLTRDGLLVHWPADRRPGPYGAKESTWSLA